MKRLGSVALISLLASSFALVGCENSSPLDKTMKAPDQKAAKAEAAPVKSDHSGSLEERVARLEDHAAKSAEAVEWLGHVYEQQQQQQKQQQEQREREEPDPGSVFAVDIAPDLKLGQVEGSPQALVTIVEAWDFA
jgi:TolA-binding protein